MSLVWKYFEKVEDKNGKAGRCIHTASCKGKTQLIKCSGGNTSGLKSHLSSFHSASYAELLLLEEEKKKSQLPKSNKRKSDGSEGPNQPLKQAKLTTTVENMCKYPDQHPVQVEFDSKFLDVLIEGFLSFGVSDLSATKDLVKFLNKKITVKHSTTYSRLAQDKYKVMMKDLKNIISEMVGSSRTCGLAGSMMPTCH